MSSATEHLERITELFIRKNQEYGSAYNDCGHTYKNFFPNGICIQDPKEFERWAIFSRMIDKMIRYSINWETGHSDSLDDIAIFAMMLRELDDGVKLK